MKHITVIKLGGFCITNKSRPYIVNASILHNLARQLSQVKTPLILIHGNGSFAHTSAKKYGGEKGYTDKLGIAKVAYDVTNLNSITGILIKEGLPAISIRCIKNEISLLVL